MSGAGEMVYVFASLAIGLAVAAWKSTDRATRIWCFVWAILNAAGAVKSIVTDDPWAFKFKPNDGVQDASDLYRPDRR